MNVFVIVEKDGRKIEGSFRWAEGKNGKTPVIFVPTRIPSKPSKKKGK